MIGELDDAAVSHRPTVFEAVEKIAIDGGGRGRRGRGKCRRSSFIEVEVIEVEIVGDRRQRTFIGGQVDARAHRQTVVHRQLAAALWVGSSMKSSRR